MKAGESVTVVGRRFRSRLALLGLSVEQAREEAIAVARAAGDHPWAAELAAFSAGSIASACRSAGVRLTTLRRLAAVAQTSVAWLIGDTEDQDPRDRAREVRG